MVSLRYQQIQEPAFVSQKLDKNSKFSWFFSRHRKGCFGNFGSLKVTKMTIFTDMDSVRQWNQNGNSESVKKGYQMNWCLPPPPLPLPPPLALNACPEAESLEFANTPKPRLSCWLPRICCLSRSAKNWSFRLRRPTHRFFLHMSWTNIFGQVYSIC